MSDQRIQQLKARQNLCWQMLSSNQKKVEDGKKLFWVSLIVGVFVVVLTTSIIGTPLFGLIVFAFLFLLLGLPGLISWLGGAGKVPQLQSELQALGNQLEELAPNKQQCSVCGAKIIGAGLFCQSCGAKIL